VCFVFRYFNMIATLNQIGNDALLMALGLTNYARPSAELLPVGAYTPVIAYIAILVLQFLDLLVLQAMGSRALLAQVLGNMCSWGGGGAEATMHVYYVGNICDTELA
jgi:hypothetical protein